MTAPHPFNAHTCARCDGEGEGVIEFGFWTEPCTCDDGDCTGRIDPDTGECERCGWHYSGPDTTPTDDGPGDAAHRMAQARRLK